MVLFYVHTSKCGTLYRKTDFNKTNIILDDPHTWLDTGQNISACQSFGVVSSIRYQYTQSLKIL
jgi:hypothetical protein